MYLPFQYTVINVNMAQLNFKTEIDDDYEAASRIQAGFRGYLQRKGVAGNQASRNGVDHKCNRSVQLTRIVKSKFHVLFH